MISTESALDEFETWEEHVQKSRFQVAQDRVFHDVDLWFDDAPLTADEEKRAHELAWTSYEKAYDAKAGPDLSRLEPTWDPSEGPSTTIQQIVHGQNRRAEKEGLDATLTVSQWETWLKAWNHICAYCQARHYFVLEHVVPISRGGPTTIYNVVPACHVCNIQKGNRSADEWLSSEQLAAFVASCITTAHRMDVAG